MSSDPATNAARTDGHGADRNLRIATAAVFAASVAALSAPVPAMPGTPGVVLGAMIVGFGLLTTGALFTAWAFLRGRPWAGPTLLLGSIATQSAIMIGFACLNNLLYLQGAVEPLADNYLFANVLRIARAFALPTRSPVICVLSLAAGLAIFLALPIVTLVRAARAAPAAWTWIHDLRVVLILWIVIWNAAMIGLTLRPFTLGYLR